MPLIMQTDRFHRMIIEGQAQRLGVHRTQHMILILRTFREGNAKVKEIRLTEKGARTAEKTEKLFDAVGNALTKGIPKGGSGRDVRL